MLSSLISCEDVVDIDTPDGTPRLVIDASLQVDPIENELTEESVIRLTLSAPFFDEEVPVVDDASVFITNVSSGEVFNFRNDPDSGFYTNRNFLPLDGNDYELTVIYNEETYKATTQLIPSVPIDSAEQGEGDLFGGNEVEVIVAFTDEAEREDYYLIDFDFDLYIPSEDRFYQGETFTFSYFYEEMIENDQITLKLIGIDKQYFNYLNILIELSEQNGDPFQSPPARIRGNMINTTNQNNFALGYFNISEVYDFTLTVDQEESN